MTRQNHGVISANIQKLLDSRSMSAMDLARKVKISPSTLTNLKRGANISVNKLSMIAEYFGYEAWVLTCPTFSSEVSQEQYNRLMEVFSDLNLDANSRENCIAFCAFQASSAKT